MYERDIWAQVEVKRQEECVTIDLDSSDLVVTASKRLREWCPGADVWAVRAFYRTLGSINCGSRRRTNGDLSVGLEATLTDGPAILR